MASPAWLTLLRTCCSGPARSGCGKRSSFADERQGNCLIVLVLVVVLVLETVHRLKGSRFGAHRTTSRYSFRRVIRPKKCCNGRLPGIAQRNAFAHGFRFVYT